MNREVEQRQQQWKTKETRNLKATQNGETKTNAKTKRKTQKVNVKAEEEATRSRGDEMETKRLIVSTNYINLHARKIERERVFDRKRAREKCWSNWIKEGTGPRIYNNSALKSPIILCFLLSKTWKKIVLIIKLKKR